MLPRRALQSHPMRLVRDGKGFSLAASEAVASDTGDVQALTVRLNVAGGDVVRRSYFVVHLLRTYSVKPGGTVDAEACRRVQCRFKHMAYRGRRRYGAWRREPAHSAVGPNIWSLSPRGSRIRQTLAADQRSTPRILEGPIQSSAMLALSTPPAVSFFVPWWTVAAVSHDRRQPPAA